MATILELIQANTVDSVDNKPFAQILVGNPKTQSGVGVFITDEQAEKSGFKPGAGWQRHKHIFKNADDFTPGYVNASPRILIVKSSGLGMFPKASGKFQCHYSEDLYYGFNGKPRSWYEKEENSSAPRLNPNKNSYDLKTKYMVFFLDDAFNYLHSVPLQLTLKGVAGGSFGGKLKEFKAVFGAVTKTNENTKSPFWIRCAFQPFFQSELVQFTGGTATVAKVVNFTLPTPESLENFFMVDESKAQSLLETRTQLKDYGWVREAEEVSDIAESPAVSTPPEASAEGTAMLAQVRKAMAQTEDDETDIPF